MGSSQTSTRSAVWWRSVVLAAIAVGLLFGAISCAARLGAATTAGHASHGAIANADGSNVTRGSVDDRAASPHAEQARTGHARTGQHGTDQHGRSDADPDRGPSPDSGRAGHVHPGMACVTPVYHGAPTAVVRQTVDQIRFPSLAEPPTCSDQPEPPVPKTS